MTMAEQTPARKAVQSIISTLVANTVNIQEAEKGRLTTNKEFLLPHLNTTELRRPPSRAPNSDKLANQDVFYCAYQQGPQKGNVGIQK